MTRIGLNRRFPRYYRMAIALATILSLSIVPVVRAAEQIIFQYGILELTITEPELTMFAATGMGTGSLKTLLNQLDLAAQEQLRAVLQAEYDVDPVLVNRFAYTRSGQQILEDVGEVLQTESGQNGFYALRAALTLAAADPEGLTLLSFLRHFPTDIRVKVAGALEIISELRGLLENTEAAMAELAAGSEAIATRESPVNFDRLPDPRESGTWSSSVQTLELYDADRDRTIAVDVYIPESPQSDRAIKDSYSFPVILVSNGLGARRSRFDELALHLASHGFAVVMLDHPGSDRQRLQEFYQGLHGENFEAAEYIDRPLDVSFVLDELTRLNSADFGDRLDPNQAAIFGYSFGGTTALALVGAEVDHDHLQQDCDTRSSLLNISLLYQCRALELPLATLDAVDLSDNRIQAAYVFVPFSRSLYGPAGISHIDRPVFWEATEQDILTPLVIEQLPVFNWLTQTVESSVDKLGTNDERATLVQEVEHYLVVTEGLPHARLTLDVLNQLTRQTVEWEDIKPIAETYHQMLATIFFQVHLAQNDEFQPYLQATGMQYLSQDPYQLHWRQESMGVGVSE